jgi:glutamyl-Q tRNA(Asp) synthetase
MADPPVLRFAPSPNGELHLGHALSALLAHGAADRLGGRFLLRIEDIDRDRCRPDYEAGILRDLAWLGLSWEQPVRRQSEHFDDYRAAAARLSEMGLLFACTCSRAQIAATVAEREAQGIAWPRDPDGAPLYPGTCRAVRADLAAIGRAEAGEAALRLDIARAAATVRDSLAWIEHGEAFYRDDFDLSCRGQRIAADPAAWGDVVICRKGSPTSYHLAVVVDDARQGISHVTRGRDLYRATSVHRLLQALLGLPAPAYAHHRLLTGADGMKLAKSRRDLSLRALREAGRSPADIRRMVGLTANG